MRGLRWMVLLTVAALGGSFIGGCAPEPVKPAPQPVMIVPASPEQADQFRADVAKMDPNARVGKVERVSEANSMAAISGLSPDEVKKGETVEFVDSRLNPIAGGTVTNSRTTGPTDPYLIVEYTVTAGGRAPVSGDLVVYLPPKH